MKIESAQISSQDSWPQLAKLESSRGRDFTNLGLLELEPWSCLGLKILVFQIHARLAKIW